MNTPENIAYTAKAEVTGGRDGRGATDDKALEVDLRAPKEMGGNGGGTNPEQLFAVGYGACFHGALRKVARESKTEIGESTVDAQVGLGKSDDGLDIAVDLTVTIGGVDQATAEKLVESAHQNCPYSRATRGNIEVNLTAKAA